MLEVHLGENLPSSNPQVRWHQLIMTIVTSSLRQLKVFYFRVGLFKIFQPDIPKLCQNLSFLYSILAYNTSICLAEITPNVAQHQILTSFIFVLY